MLKLYNAKYTAIFHLKLRTLNENYLTGKVLVSHGDFAIVV
jgi:hypothetical protein